MSVFWPNLNGHINDIVSRCELCQQNRNRQPKEPMISHDIPDEPWTKVASDLFKIGTQDYLCIIDYNSKFFDVYDIPDATGETVVEYTKSSFSRFGTPKEVITDNGPCYDSRVYKHFSKSWDFKHNTSSPLYPESNGMAERTVQTVKKTIRKCKRNGEDVHLALLAIRSTPRKSQLYSPGEILMKRK